MNTPSRPRHPAPWFGALALFLFATPVVAQPLRWTQRDGYREAALQVTSGGRSGFTLLKPEQTGVFFTNTMGYARSEANQNLINGCGVAAGDYDGDGWCDLYFANTDLPNGLFRNQGNWKFSDTTAAAGVGAGTNSASKGVVFADADGDGRLDLVVGMLGGPHALFLNQGAGRFTNAAGAAGLSSRTGTHSVSLADVDGDGDLDIYFANYGELSILRSGGSFGTRMVNGKPVVTGRWAKRLRIVDGRIIELGEPDALYLNNGQGGYAPVSWTGGAFLDADGRALKSEPYDMGLSVVFRDINGDSAPDIYVCNDFQAPDRIWINDGKGGFRALPDLAVRATPHFSMGVDFADLDRDGFDDFFVGDMLSRRHSLRMTQTGATNPTPAEVGEPLDRNQNRANVLNFNRGDGTYANLAAYADVLATDWTWSVVFLDVDFDGFEDLLVVNAHGYDTQDLDMTESVPSEGGAMRVGKQLKNFPGLITPNYLLRNRGNRTFEEVGAKWGFDSTNVSHGIALADFDLDGDLDMAVSCLWQPPLLYRNESSAPRVAVRLRGASKNTRGIGAKIKLLGGAMPTQSQEIHAGGRYLSADDTMRTFAAGTLTNQMTLEVTWRSGKRSVINGVRANHLYEIDEAGAKDAPKMIPDQPPALFTDATAALGHTNSAATFNDFEHQPLMPHSLSRSGPGVAWIDLDSDGREELVIGDAAGGTVAVFAHDAKGAFTRRPATPPLTADMAGLAAWSAGNNQRALLSAQSGLRSPDVATPPLALLTTNNSASPVPTVSLPKTAAGPVSTADIDGDGDLDVFIGGRVVPGRYPEAATSLLLLNDAGTLKPDPAIPAALKEAGLVSSAVFTDLDADGDPDLALACEWGPLRLFRNDAGKLAPWDAAIDSSPLTMSRLTGWWNSVAAGDFDGDGRMDLVAGNWGLNSSYATPDTTHPVRMYHGDFDGNGSIDLLETEWEEITRREVPRRDLKLLSAGWPELRTRFPSHRAFSRADFTEVLGPAAAKARRVEATILASMLFLNRGTKFEARPLPAAAQYSPAFGLVVADFDGDGAEDLFLAQNFFANRPEEPRLDAGLGLLLRGDARGNFTVLAPMESGVRIHGEQRGAAAADFDEDGRIDLVVAQHGSATRLMRNAHARPGLRVRLHGPAANPDALGARVRLKFGSKSSPARERHGGGGYWSQDSAVMILATPEPPTEIEVQWPGGQQTVSKIPPDAKSITVNADGTTR